MSDDFPNQIQEEDIQYFMQLTIASHLAGAHQKLEVQWLNTLSSLLLYNSLDLQMIICLCAVLQNFALHQMYLFVLQPYFLWLEHLFDWGAENELSWMEVAKLS